MPSKKPITNNCHIVTLDACANCFRGVLVVVSVFFIYVDFAWFLLVRSIDRRSPILSRLPHYHLATFLRLFFYVSGGRVKINQQLHAYRMLRIWAGKSQRPHRAGLCGTDPFLSPHRFKRGLIIIIGGFSSGILPCSCFFSFMLRLEERIYF